MFNNLIDFFELDEGNRTRGQGAQLKIGKKTVQIRSAKVLLCK